MWSISSVLIFLYFILGGFVDDLLFFIYVYVLWILCEFYLDRGPYRFPIYSEWRCFNNGLYFPDLFRLCWDNRLSYDVLVRFIGRYLEFILGRLNDPFVFMGDE